MCVFVKWQQPSFGKTEVSKGKAYAFILE